MCESHLPTSLLVLLRAALKWISNLVADVGTGKRANRESCQTIARLSLGLLLTRRQFNTIAPGERVRENTAFPFAGYDLFDPA